MPLFDHLISHTSFPSEHRVTTLGTIAALATLGSWSWLPGLPNYRTDRRRCAGVLDLLEVAHSVLFSLMTVLIFS